MQYSHSIEYGNNDFHEEVHHSQLRIYFWNAFFRQGGGIPFSFGMDSSGDRNLVHTLLDDYIFKTSVTLLLLILTAGTTLVVIYSAQILQTTLLKMDPQKMKNKEKLWSFCLPQFAQQPRFLGTESAGKTRVRNMTWGLFFCLWSFSPQAFHIFSEMKTGQGNATGTSCLPFSLQYISWTL